MSRCICKSSNSSSETWILPSPPRDSHRSGRAQQHQDAAPLLRICTRLSFRSTCMSNTAPKGQPSWWLQNYGDNHVFCLQSNGTWDDLGLRVSIGDDNHCAVQQVPNPVTATGKDDIYQDHIPRFIWIDQKEGNWVHLFCPFYSPNLEIRRISHGETNISKADNGAEFPLKFLLLIWSRLYSLLPSVSSSVEYPSERHIQQKSHRHQTRTLFTAQHQGHKGQKGRERTRQHQICAATCCVGLRRYFSPGHWHRVQESGKKNIPASQRAPVPHQCVRNEKKILLYHIFSTSLGLSKEQGTWKQLFIESTAVSRRLGWEEQEEIHKLHFLPDLVL